MDSNMKLKFGHPCNNCSDMEKPIYKVRTIPSESKLRINLDLDGSHFVWKFRQWGYHFFFEYFDDGHFVLEVSNDPSDPYDWQQVEDCTIIKD
jgi:hypothetical protein